MQGDITDHDITEAMITYGGGFTSLLGELFRCADAMNQARLKDAFPDYWERYRMLVVLQRERA